MPCVEVITSTLCCLQQLSQAKHAINSIVPSTWTWATLIRMRHLLRRKCNRSEKLFNLNSDESDFTEHWMSRWGSFKAQNSFTVSICWNEMNQKWNRWMNVLKGRRIINAARPRRITHSGQCLTETMRSLLSNIHRSTNWLYFWIPPTPITKCRPFSSRKVCCPLIEAIDKQFWQKVWRSDGNCCQVDLLAVCFQLKFIPLVVRKFRRFLKSPN